MANQTNEHRSQIIQEVHHAIHNKQSLYINFRVPTFDLPAYLEAQAAICTALQESHGAARVIGLSPTNIEAGLAEEALVGILRKKRQPHDTTLSRRSCEDVRQSAVSGVPTENDNVMPDDSFDNKQTYFTTYKKFVKSVLDSKQVTDDGPPGGMDDVGAIFIHESIHPTIDFELALGIISDAYASRQQPLIVLAAWRYENQMALLDRWMGKGFRARHPTQPRLEPPPDAEYLPNVESLGLLIERVRAALENGRDVVSFAPPELNPWIAATITDSWSTPEDEDDEDGEDDEDDGHDQGPLTLEELRSDTEYAYFRNSMSSDASGRPRLIGIDPTTFSQGLPMRNVGLVVVIAIDRRNAIYRKPCYSDNGSYSLSVGYVHGLNTHQLATQFEYATDDGTKWLVVDGDLISDKQYRTRNPEGGARTIYDWRAYDGHMLTFAMCSIMLWPGRDVSSMPLRRLDGHLMRLAEASNHLAHLGFVQRIGDGYALSDRLGGCYTKLFRSFDRRPSFYDVGLIATAGSESPERLRRLIVRIAHMRSTRGMMAHFPSAMFDPDSIARSFASWSWKQGSLNFMANGSLWFALGCWENVRLESNNFMAHQHGHRSFGGGLLDGGAYMDDSMAANAWRSICRCEAILGLAPQDVVRDDITEDDVQQVANHLMWIFAPILVAITRRPNGQTETRSIRDGDEIEACIEGLDEFVAMHLRNINTDQDAAAVDTIIALPRDLSTRPEERMITGEITVVGFTERSMLGWQLPQL